MWHGKLRQSMEMFSTDCLFYLSYQDCPWQAPLLHIKPRSQPPAAVPLQEEMGHDDLRGHQVGVLDMVDHLGGRLDPQLEGVHVHGGQLRGGEPGK